MKSGGHGDHKKLYLLIGLWLFVFTAVTVAAAQLHLPMPRAVLLALVIATIKAALVGMFFMHLKYERGALLLSLLALTAFFVVVLVSIPMIEFSGTPYAEAGSIPAVTAPAHGHP